MIYLQDIENKVNGECKEITINESDEEDNVVIRIKADKELVNKQKDELENVGNLCENITEKITEVIIKNENVEI